MPKIPIGFVSYRIVTAATLFVALLTVAEVAKADEHIGKTLDFVSKNIKFLEEERTIEQFEWHLSAAFNRLDVDINDVIDIHDTVLGEQWYNAGARPNPTKLNQQRYDLDGDGVLSEAEVRKAISYEVRSDLGLGEGVPQLDLDKEIEDRIEWSKRPKKIESFDGMNVGPTDQEALEEYPADPELIHARIIARGVRAASKNPPLKGFDVDQDGAVSREEFFLPLMQALMDSDLNKDGIISEEELQ